MLGRALSKIRVSKPQIEWYILRFTEKHTVFAVFFTWRCVLGGARLEVSLKVRGYLNPSPWSSGVVYLGLMMFLLGLTKTPFGDFCKKNRVLKQILV